MNWKLIKPGIKGLIIGLIPIIVAVIFYLIMLILYFILPKSADGPWIMWLIIPVLVFIFYSSFFLIFSILIGLYFQYKKNKKIRIIFLGIILCFIIFTIAFITSEILVNIKIKNEYKSNQDAWESERQLKYELAMELCGEIDSKQENYYYYIPGNGSIKKTFDSITEKLEFEKSINYANVGRYNAQSECLKENKLPTNILD